MYGHRPLRLLDPKALLLLLLLAWGATGDLCAQVCDSLHFTNPSMEGPGHPTYPDGWLNCFGSSNVQPGLFGCDAEPTDGSRYLGFHSSDAGGERIHQELSQPLIDGRTYDLIFDVIVEPTPNVPEQWGGGGYGDHEGYVEVYASTDPCGQDVMIGVTPLLNSAMGWTTVDMEFVATQAFTHFTFVPHDTEGLWVYFAIDNLRNGIYCDCINGPLTEEFVEICAGDSVVTGVQTITEDGVYIENYDSSIGCDSTVIVDLTVFPSYEYFNAVQICQGGEYAQGSSVYTQSGTYTDVYQTTEGCDSAYVTVLTAEEQLFFSDTVRICAGEGIDLHGEWRTETGNYTQTYTAVAGCDSTVITFLEVLEPVTVQQQILRCTDDSYSLGGSIYLEDGFYSDTLSTIYGCDSIVNTELRYLREGEILPADTTLCAGDQVYIDLSDLDVDMMFWSNSFTPPFMSIEESSTDWIDLYWGNCHISDTIEVRFDESPPEDIEAEICDGSEYVLDLGYLGGVIDWSDGSTDFQQAITHSTELTAVVDNVCGRFDLSLAVDIINCECPVFAPNAFSPDSDGVNESFGIDCACQFAKYEFVVFDRYGQIVFESTDPSARWDGSFSGRNIAVEAGEYNWILNYAAVSDDGAFSYELLRGAVMVMR